MKKLIATILAAVLLLACACWAEEEIYPTGEFDIDAYNGILQITYADGGIEETGGWGFSVDITEKGMTIGDVLAGFDIASLDVVGADDVFEGWLAFSIDTIIDEFGFEEYVYVLANDAPISTEELLAAPVSENRMMYAAKWESMAAEEYFQVEEEEEETIYMAAATMFANGGSFLMHSEDEDYETSLNVATFEPGQLLGDALELDSLLGVSREGYNFSGWTVYKVGWMEITEEMTGTDGAPCFELGEDWYCTLHESSVIGQDMDTLAIGELVCGESDLFICATWE